MEHVSVDIDVLVRRKHIYRAVERLRNRSFKLGVSEPYTVTMTRGRAIVDLYTRPSFAWMVYLDGEQLLEEVKTAMVERLDVEIRMLTKEAEAVVTAVHSVYKEHIYLLADHYVTKQWLTSKAINLARELCIEEAYTNKPKV